MTDVADRCPDRVEDAAADDLHESTLRGHPLRQLRAVPQLEHRSGHSTGCAYDSRGYHSRHPRGQMPQLRELVQDGCSAEAICSFEEAAV